MVGLTFCYSYNCVSHRVTSFFLSLASSTICVPTPSLNNVGLDHNVGPATRQVLKDINSLKYFGLGMADCIGKGADRQIGRQTDRGSWQNMFSPLG